MRKCPELHGSRFLTSFGSCLSSCTFLGSSSPHRRRSAKFYEGLRGCYRSRSRGQGTSTFTAADQRWRPSCVLETAECWEIIPNSSRRDALPAVSRRWMPPLRREANRANMSARCSTLTRLAPNNYYRDRFQSLYISPWRPGRSCSRRAIHGSNFHAVCCCGAGRRLLVQHDG